VDSKAKYTRDCVKTLGANKTVLLPTYYWKNYRLKKKQIFQTKRDEFWDGILRGVELVNIIMLKG